MNIYQRINAVKRDVKYIVKDAQIQNYRAVTHDAVTAMVRKACVDHGVVITQTLGEGQTVEVGSTSRGAAQRMYDATFIIEFVNEDEPSDKFAITVPAQAIDTADKAIGKAMSYAMKYALLKTFQIETGENEESRQEVIQKRVETSELIANEQLKRLESLLEKSEKDASAAAKHYGVDSISDMNAVQRADLEMRLSKYIESRGDKHEAG